MNKVLILGHGKLGSEIVKQTGWDYLSRAKNGFDITNINHIQSNLSKHDTIVNCIANTNTYSENKQEHWLVNYKAVHDLVIHCNKSYIKLVHISSDFVYANSDLNKRSENDIPVHSCNWYSYTKLLADGIVELLSDNYLICRCTHKEFPFPYKNAFIDRVGNFDYTDKIAELIIKLVNNNSTGLFNVGTELKTMYDLAKQSNKDVTPVCADKKFPNNTSMDLDKLKKELNFQ